MSDKGNDLVVRGDLAWKDHPKGEVVFVPSESGRFLFQTKNNLKK